MDYDIVSIGSATADIFADTNSELIRMDTRLSHRELLAFPLGSKILINSLNITTGGGGTNSATCFARLGLKTGYVGKVGADVQGQTILDFLQRENIDFLGGREGVSGISLILNSIREDRTILVFKGANNTLAPEEIQKFNTQWVYLSSMMEQSWDSVCEFVLSSGFKLAFNPSTYQATKGYDSLKNIIARAAILVINHEEASLLLGLDPDCNEDVVKLLVELHSKVDGQIVVITDGRNGAWVGQGQVIYHGKPHSGLVIKEATGAGDAFASTFTAAVIKGLHLKEALHMGMTNAESVLQYRGAKEKLLSWGELVEATENYNREIHQLAG